VPLLLLPAARGGPGPARKTGESPHSTVSAARVCNPPGGRVYASPVFASEAPDTYDTLVRADTVIVPAVRDAHEEAPPDLVEAVKAAHANGARVASLCSGAFVLAAAGLLDGRKATTHWLYAAELARRFPAVDVDPDVLYIDNGDVLTSAGTTAGIDACLAMVAADHGADLANTLARRLVAPRTAAAAEPSTLKRRRRRPRTTAWARWWTGCVST
jgi:AraC family transcriptional activator FtrA